MTHRKFLQNTQAGIALLMTIIVLGVVLSVTLAIVELSLQHLALSVDTRDSEIAFHAANSGLECARYTRRNASSSFEQGATTVSLNCFGTTTPSFVKIANGISTSTSQTATGFIYRYKASITSGNNDRCSVIDMITMVVSSTSPKDLVIKAASRGSLELVFPGYGHVSKSCSAGSVCTIASVAGYNVACTPAGNLTADGVLKRQVLLEF